MFGWFKKQRVDERSTEINIIDAYELVTLFGDLLAKSSPYIGDSSDLPADKTQMVLAFDHYIEWLECDDDASKSSANAGKLDAARALRSRLVLDFHDIDPEDRDRVKYLNSLPKIPAEEQRFGIKLYRKYNGESEAA